MRYIKIYYYHYIPCCSINILLGYWEVLNYTICQVSSQRSKSIQSLYFSALQVLGLTLMWDQLSLPDGWVMMARPLLLPAGWVMMARPLLLPAGWVMMARPLLLPAGWVMMARPLLLPAGWVMMARPLLLPLIQGWVSVDRLPSRVLSSPFLQSYLQRHI